MYDNNFFDEYSGYVDTGLSWKQIVKKSKLLRGCIICESYKHSNQMDYHQCPFKDKSSVGKL